MGKVVESATSLALNRRRTMVRRGKKPYVSSFPFVLRVSVISYSSLFNLNPFCFYF